MKPMILNLGCGEDYVDGAVNVDYFARRVDVRHELNTFPYPFSDNEFDEIHWGYGGITSDRQGWLQSDDTGAALSYEDLTHKHGFTWRSFDIFNDSGSVYGDYSDIRFEYEHRAYTPYKLPWLYRLLSRFPIITDNLVSKFIPMASILIVLRVCK